MLKKMIMVGISTFMILTNCLVSLCRNSVITSVRLLAVQLKI